MSRNREILPDFWTWEAVIGCTPMTRLLFLGLWNFADGIGVQPLRPRTIRMQAFPGDPIDGDAVRAMIGELAARGLVRHCSIDGQGYIAIFGWDRLQRAGKCAKRRFPGISEMDQGLTRSAPSADTSANHSNPPPTAQAEGSANHSSPPPASRPEDSANHSNPSSTWGKEDWQAVTDERLRQASRGSSRLQPINL